MSFHSTWVPVANICLGMIGFLILSNRVIVRRQEYPREVLGVFLVLMAFVAALLETTAEQLARNLETSMNAFVICAVKICLLVWLYRSRNSIYRTGDRDRNPGQNDQGANSDVLLPKHVDDDGTL